MPKEKLDLTGRRFGMLTVLHESTEKHSGRSTWTCICDCGTIKDILSYRLTLGRSRSCGCQRTSQKYEHPSERLYHDYLRGAEQRDLSWRLSIKDFELLITQECHYCGCKPGANGLHKSFNGVDRINSKKGYSPDNCVPCCSICNYAKQSLSRREFISWIQRAYTHLKEHNMLEQQNTPT